jgi:Protein of unknown function (DUF4013)
MNLDIKRAILSPFSDSKWYVKLAIPFLWHIANSLYFHFHKILVQDLTFLQLALLLPFLLILPGFYLNFVHNEIHNIKPLLPNWKGNWLNFLKNGASFYIIFLFVLMLALIIVCLPLLTIFHIFHPNPYSGSLVYELTSILSFPAILFFAFLCFFLVCIYVDNFKLLDCFNLKHVLRTILSAKNELSIYVILPAVFYLLHYLTSFYFKNILLYILFIIAVFLFNFFFFNLLAQVYKSTKIKSKQYGELA